MPALDPARTPLVLVHGWAGSSAVWDAVAPALARAGFTGPIVSVDLPGSPRASDEHPATVPEAVDRVVAATEAFGRARGSSWTCWSTATQDTGCCSTRSTTA